MARQTTPVDTMPKFGQPALPEARRLASQLAQLLDSLPPPEAATDREALSDATWHVAQLQRCLADVEAAGQKGGAA